MHQNIKVGVFVDAENIRYNGGYQLRYDILRRFAARYGGSLLRLNTYLAFDKDRAKEDSEYAKRAYSYQQMVRDFGWKITVKAVRRYTDEEGNLLHEQLSYIYGSIFYAPGVGPVSCHQRMHSVGGGILVQEPIILDYQASISGSEVAGR